MSINNRNQSAIPSVPPSVSDPALRHFLASLQQSMQTFQGGRTSVAELDRAVTLRELQDGQLKFNRSALVKSLTDNYGKNPIEDWANDTVEEPTKPSGFEVAVGMTAAVLSWDIAEYKGHSHTEVFRQRTALDKLGNPVDKPQFDEKKLLHAITIGFVLSDPLDYYSGYYYWIRHVNRDSVVGPLSSTDGFFIKTRRTIEDEMKAAGLANILGFDDIPDEYKGSDVIYNRQLGQLLYWNGKEYTRNIPIDGIPDGAIGLTKFARGLAPVGLHDTVPKDYANTDVVFVDGSLYRWDGKKYTANIPSINIEGVLDPSAIPSIPTSKLSGTVNANQIAANAIGANHILAGAVNTDHLAANSIVAGKIRAGAIGAEQIHAGQLTADHFAVGVGGNLLVNPILANPVNGVPFGWGYYNGSVGSNGYTIGREARESSTAAFFIQGLETERLIVAKVHCDATQAAVLKANQYWYDALMCSIRVTPGKRYCFSAYLSLHRCAGILVVDNHDGAGNYVSYNTSTVSIGDSAANSSAINRGSFVNGLKTAGRYWVFFTAPESGHVSLHFRVNEYSGHANPDAYIARPMLEEVTEHTQTPAPWQLGGVTAIHGGSLVNDSITTGKIAANTIGTLELIAGAITADKIAGGAITGDKIAASQTLTSPIINGGEIRGTNITATNTVNGARINGGSIHGAEIYGTTIHGGTIYSAHLESATGRFTGDLEVTQIIGGGIFQRGIARSRVIGQYAASLYYHRVRFIVHARNARRTLLLKYIGYAGSDTGTSHVGGGSNNDGTTYYYNYLWPKNVRIVIASGSGHVVDTNNYAVINAGSTVTVDFLFDMASPSEKSNKSPQAVEWILAVDSGANITIE